MIARGNKLTVEAKILHYWKASTGMDWCIFIVYLDGVAQEVWCASEEDA